MGAEYEQSATVRRIIRAVNELDQGAQMAAQKAGEDSETVSELVKEIADLEAKLTALDVAVREFLPAIDDVDRRFTGREGKVVRSADRDALARFHLAGAKLRRALAKETDS